MTEPGRRIHLSDQGAWVGRCSTDSWSLLLPSRQASPGHRLVRRLSFPSDQASGEGSRPLLARSLLFPA
jgi:hypothetical protein